MTDYKPGLAYFEIHPPKKNGDPLKGVYEIVEEDRYYLLLRDDNIEFLASKRSIDIYEPDKDKWPDTVFNGVKF
jgi:hypothetical protein